MKQKAQKGKKKKTPLRQCMHLMYLIERVISEFVDVPDNQ
jgi:hypothetical protein